MRREAARVGDMQAPLLQDAAEGLEDMEEEEVGGTAAAAAGAPGMRRRRSAYSREDSGKDLLRRRE
jgi:MYXO-CTERM domain-containing protein